MDPPPPFCFHGLYSFCSLSVGLVGFIYKIYLYFYCEFVLGDPGDCRQPIEFIIGQHVVPGFKKCDAPLLDASNRLKVNLPKSGAPSKMDGPKMQAITVDNSGNIKLNAEPCSLADLENKLGAVKAKTPESPIVVRGDSQTQYQTIMDVIDVIGRVGFSNIGLATKPKGQ